MIQIRSTRSKLGPPYHKMWPSRNQSHSIALSRTQSPSAAPAHRSHPTTHLPSEVIRGHHRSSEVIRGHQRSSDVIRGHQPHRPIHLIRPLICWQVGTAVHAFTRDQPPVGIDIACRAASHLWGRGGRRRGEHIQRLTSNVAFGCNQVKSIAIKCNHLPGGIRWQAEALSSVGRSAVHHLRDLCIRSQHIPAQ